MSFYRKKIVIFWAIEIYESMKLYACQNKNFAPFLYSSCVEETAICNGTSVCDNKEDLRQCKNKTRWENATPMFENVQCPGTGQQIKSGSKNNGIFDCINRRDEEETTFNKKNSDNSTQDWLREVHKPCPKGENYRRCLGNQPNRCVHSKCKFLLIIIRSKIQ